MKVEIQSLDAKFDGDGLVLPFWAPSIDAIGGADGKPNAKGAAARTPIQLPAWAAGMVGADEFTATPGQMVMLRLPDKQPAARVILLGLGEAGKSPAYALAGWYAGAFGALKSSRCEQIGLVMPESGIDGAQSGAGADTPELPGQVVSQSVMADLSFDRYKPAPLAGEPQRTEVKRLVLVVASDKLADARAAAERGRVMGEAANLTRRMQNEPANVASPSWVAEQARAALRGRPKLRLRVLDRGAMSRAGLQALLAVAGASAQEPRLVVLEYRGAPGRSGWDTAIVGKGVTFDSGGISIKPASKMDEMKFDKSGACAVIGALAGCADLRLAVNVVGVAALVENMPDARAYRPGDIVRAMNGVTIEVLSTDAEGRLVLADALAWTVKNYAPATMVDMATLTGACAVALGDLASGLLTRDEQMAHMLMMAGEASGERLWRLPFWPEYDEKVKSEIATVKNMGEPGQGGTIAGASFLRYFAGERAWAHIDIAGTAYGSKPRAGMAPGGYGTGVRLMLEYLRIQETALKTGKKQA